MKKLFLMMAIVVVTLSADQRSCMFWAHKYAAEMRKVLAARDAGVDGRTYMEMAQRYGIEVLGECENIFDKETLDGVRKTVKGLGHDLMGK